VTRLLFTTVISLIAIPLALGAAPQPPRTPDVVFIPTPADVVKAMLEMAEVTASDVVYDLGSGDGRIVIAAVKDFGAARGVGIELDPFHVLEARANARRLGVDGRVEFRRQDLFETDLREATVVALYLLPAVNARLRPKLLSELRSGTRVVSHAFDMGNWTPDEERTVSGRKVFLWHIPAPR
jgi:hypothetical protein